MKRYIGVIFTLLICSLPYTATAQKEAKAKQILDKTAEAFKKAAPLSADFTLTVWSHGSPQNKTSGTIVLKGEKFHLTTPSVITWFNGETQWSYLPANEEVNISQPTEEELQNINPYSFVKLYRKGYDYRMGDKTSYKGKAIHEIRLTAENDKSPFSEVTLYVTQADLLPLYLKVKEQGGGYNTIDIRQCQQRVNANEKDFEFDKKKYPHAEVIDLR